MESNRPLQLRGSQLDNHSEDDKGFLAQPVGWLSSGLSAVENLTTTEA
jgi:hypothetical protein